MYLCSFRYLEMMHQSQNDFNVLRNEEPFILVMDNGDELVEKMSGMYHVVTTSSDDVAIGYLKEPYPSAVLISGELHADFTGRVCRHIRSSASCSHIPVIYLVKELSDQLELDALNSGYNEVMLYSSSEELVTLRIDVLVNRLGKCYRRPRFLERVDQVLFENIEYSTFHVEDLAARLHMDRKTLYTRIKRDSGLTPQIYIRNTRICRAAHLLKMGTLTVSEAAFQTGFPDVSYFSRCFKAYFRKSPSEFLRKYIS